MASKPYFTFEQYIKYISEEDPIGSPPGLAAGEKLPSDAESNDSDPNHDPNASVSMDKPSVPPEEKSASNDPLTEPNIDNEDPNRQGVIRTVPKAHLVYKRQTSDGTYEELWIYTTGGSMQDELTIRRAILAGTDIPANKVKSPDGSQSYEIWTVGNGQLLNIKGLPQ